MTTASLSVMNRIGREAPSRPLAAGGRRSDALGLWIVLALGALLMLAASFLKSEEPGFTARRTDRFNGTLSPGATLRIENISGEVVASPGKEFTAVVSVSASAPTKERAEELLRATTIAQKQEGRDLSLQTIWPEKGWEKSSPRTRGDFEWRWHGGRPRCDDCKITAQFQVTVPPGVRAALHTVNGDVRTSGMDGDVALRSVNGAVVVRGGRRGVAAESVNGKIDVVMQELPASASLQASTVNGSVLVTLPKDAKFDLSASTMNGTIASTFPLPSRIEPAEVPEPPEPPKKPERAAEPREKTPKPPAVRHDGGEDFVDVEALQKEIAESMKLVDAQVRESLRNYNREMRHLNLMNLHRAYSGAIGQGGGRVRVTTLNGSVTVLAAGTREADAKPLVPERRAFAVTIPPVQVHPKVVVRVMPHEIPEPADFDEAVVRGDVSGDFLATSGGGSYRIGHVSGNVKILTRSGEIHVASAGAGADLKSYGGDVKIGPVSGDLKAQTLAGDIRAGTVSGSAILETSGGDIRVDGIGGSAGARTGGGDIVLPSVRGSVEAETGGGDVRVAILSREARGRVSIRDSGGDVTLTLPADFRGDIELEVRDGDPEDTLIRSDFPQITQIRQGGAQRATGTLGGGGSKVVVSTYSGTIRLRKGPPAAN